MLLYISSRQSFQPTQWFGLSVSSFWAKLSIFLKLTNQSKVVLTYIHSDCMHTILAQDFQKQKTLLCNVINCVTVVADIYILLLDISNVSELTGYNHFHPDLDIPLRVPPDADTTTEDIKDDALSG